MLRERRTGGRTARIFIFAALASALSLPAFASLQVFTLERGTVKINVPSRWQNVRDLYGMPLTLLGPEKDGSRPVITVTATGKTGVRFDAEALRKNQGEYRQGREEFVKGMGGRVLGFFDYETLKWAGIQEAHVVGYRYAVMEREFREKSYYIVCKDKLFHIKTMLTKETESAYGEVVERAVKSFACE